MGLASTLRFERSIEQFMKLRVAGINFDHMHMGDLLRMAHEHPGAEIVGICDDTPSRMQSAARNFGISRERIFTDIEECLEKTRPQLVVLCPATARHAEYAERIAPHHVHILIEKPFAASIKEADLMIAAARKHKVMLAINWPLRWCASHCTAYRLLAEDRIGSLEEVHYYGGNRGPLWHTADKLETTPTPAMKRRSWFYSQEQGGGSLLDYLGYGTTLGHLVSTWPQTDRGYRGDGPPERPRSGRAQHHDRALRVRLVQVGNALGDFHRSLEASASTQVRIHSQRNAGDD
jgi:glucose-fructose oxidoreductase